MPLPVVGRREGGGGGGGGKVELTIGVVKNSNPPNLFEGD